MAEHAVSHFAELLRNDFAAFAHRAFLELYPSRAFESNWHIEVLAAKLDAVRRGEIKRLIINVPPRSMKSILGSIMFPAFVLGHEPSAEVLCLSYGERIANNFALPCRQLMLSRFYQALFKTRLSGDKQAVDDFLTTSGGARRAVSWGGAITGQGADYLIIDDPLKVEEGLSETSRTRTNESYSTTVSSRANRDSCAIIIIMQRLHINDLCGFVQMNQQERWEVVALPALAGRDEEYPVRTPFGSRTLRRPKGQALQPTRISEQSLIVRRATTGSRTFDAQYQQKPHGAENAIIKREWLAYYDENTKPAIFDRKIQNWDTASKSGAANSYNACTTWGILENRFYLLDVVCEHLDFRELKNKAISLAKEYNPTTILIEDQSSGLALASELGKKGYPVQPVPTGNVSKADRLGERANLFETDRVLLPRTASWLDGYVEELTTFPDSDFSDRVDSTSQALAYDTSSGSADNAIRAMRLLSGETSVDGEDRKLVKFRVKIGGGVIQFHDGSGRPATHVPEAGSIIEVDEDVAAILNRDWQRFVRMPD